VFIPLILLLGCCLQGFDPRTFIGNSLYSGFAQAQSCRAIGENTRAVIRDEALADSPGIIALSYGASNMVG
jgi:hypothetical protein